MAAELADIAARQPRDTECEKVESYADRGPLCQWLDSYEKSHHDDRTIVILQKVIQNEQKA